MSEAFRRFWQNDGRNQERLFDEQPGWLGRSRRCTLATPQRVGVRFPHGDLRTVVAITNILDFGGETRNLVASLPGRSCRYEVCGDSYR